MPQTPPPEPSAAPRSQAPKFVLIGEDDIDDQELFTEIFDTVKENVELRFAKSGLEILQYLENCQGKDLPCLIILDYNMPELNGAEILEKLREKKEYDHIPKIIWSTSGSKVFREKSLEFGANAYIIKPSNVNELKEVASYMLSYC